MKKILFVLALLAAGLWTGGAVLTTGLLGWIAEAMPRGGVTDLGGLLQSWPALTWLGLWVDPQTLETIRLAIAAVIQSTLDFVPTLEQALRWLIPAVWVTWAIGLAAMIVLSGFTYWLLLHFGAPTPAPAVAKHR